MYCCSLHTDVRPMYCSTIGLISRITAVVVTQQAAVPHTFDFQKSITSVVQTSAV